MGGYFAMAFAAAHPKRVRRLVLVGAPAGLDRKLPLFIRLLGYRISGRLMSVMKIKDPETLRRQVFAGLLVAHADTLPLEFLEISLAAELIPGTDRSARSMLRAVTSLRGWRKQSLMRRHHGASAGLDTLSLGRARCLRSAVNSARNWRRECLQPAS